MIRYLLFIIIIAIIVVGIYSIWHYFVGFIVDWIKRKIVSWRNKQKKKYDKRK